MLAHHQNRHQATRDGHLIFLRGLCGYIWINILTLLPLRVQPAIHITGSKLGIVFIRSPSGMHCLPGLVNAISTILLSASLLST